MKCSIDDSTEFALRDFRNVARPGVFAPWGAGMVAQRTQRARGGQRAVESGGQFWRRIVTLFAGAVGGGTLRRLCAVTQADAGRRRRNTGWARPARHWRGGCRSRCCGAGFVWVAARAAAAGSAVVFCAGSGVGAGAAALVMPRGRSSLHSLSSQSRLQSNPNQIPAPLRTRGGSRPNPPARPPGLIRSDSPPAADPRASASASAAASRRPPAARARTPSRTPTSAAQPAIPAAP